MGGIFGGGSKSISTTDKMAAGMRFQTSAFGLALPLLYGCNLVAGNLIDYMDFRAIAQTSSQSVGGKGGGTPAGSTTYRYKVALMLGLVEGPLASGAAKRIWLGKTKYDSPSMFEFFRGTYPQGAWGYLVTHHAARALGYHGLAYLAASDFDLGDNPDLPNINLELVGFLPYALPEEVTDYPATIPTASGGTHGWGTSLYRKVTVPHAAYFQEDNGVRWAVGGAPLTKVAANPATGEYAVAHGVYSFSRDDEGADVLISYAWEDNLGAEPWAIIQDLLTNERYGLGLPAARCADWSDYRDYCRAYRFLLSPYLAEPTELREILKRWMIITNAEIVWSGGQIKIVPYGDTPATGLEDVTWTPDLTPLYHLTDEDFLPRDKKAPVRLMRNDPADAYNLFRLEFLNRDQDFAPEPAEFKAQPDIEDKGLKPGELFKAHEITQGDMANNCVHLMGQRKLYKRNNYDFLLNWRYDHLEPMDLVTLTHAPLGLNRQLVRLKDKAEEEDGNWRWLAEKVILGVASPPGAGRQGGGGNAIDRNVDPGDANEPLLFQPPPALLTAENEVWAAISGGENWGGCNIWICEDDANYKNVGQVWGNARRGVLRAALPEAPESPDETNTLQVDLTISRGELKSGSEDDANRLNTLCYVDGEYLAYKTATLTGAYQYDLTWLVRGAYGSGMVERAEGAPFARLDQGIFKYPCKRRDIGKTIYIKLQSFNAYGRAVQDLSELSPYLYAIVNPGDQTPAAIVGLTAANNGVSPDTKLDVALDSAVLYDDEGSGFGVQGLGFTIDAGAVGINGLDTGSLAADQWYYYFAIANAVQGQVAGLLSLSRTAPALPAGYTHKRLLGPVRTDGSGNFKRFNQVGNAWNYEDVQPLASDTTDQNWTDQGAGGYIPPMSTRGAFSLQVHAAAGAVSFGLRKNGSSATLGQLQGSAPAAGSARADGCCDTDGSQVVELQISVAVIDWSLYVSGFVLNL